MSWHLHVGFNGSDASYVIGRLLSSLFHVTRYTYRIRLSASEALARPPVTQVRKLHRLPILLLRTEMDCAQDN